MEKERSVLEIRKKFHLFRSVQFSHSVVSDSLWPHEPQHTRPPCPSPTPRVHPNSCPSSQWCHPTMSSSVVPFSSCPQPFPASGSFPLSQFFASGGQRTGASASASVSGYSRCAAVHSWYSILLFSFLCVSVLSTCHVPTPHSVSSEITGSLEDRGNQEF